MDRKDYVADRREVGGWMVMHWDADREIYVEGATYRTKREAEEALREQRARSEAAAVLGRKGGQAGRGASKARAHTTPEHMRAIRAAANRCTYCDASPAQRATVWEPCGKHGTTYTQAERIVCAMHASEHANKPFLFSSCDCGN